MRQLRQWKRLFLIVALALLGTAVATSLLPAHQLTGSRVVLSAPEHQHQDDCCPSAVCDVGCITSGSCDANLLALQSSTDVDNQASGAALTERDMVESSASVFLESPPPRV
jgi:hypothetical protein